jgi:hypothetical protein
MRVGALLLWGLSAACEDSATALDPSKPPMEVACGFGEASFTPLLDGEPVPVELRPAGGWVVYGAVSVANGGPDVSLVPRLSLPDAGELLISTPGAPLYRAPHLASSECSGEYWSVEAYVNTEAIDAGQDPVQVMCDQADAPLTLSITVEDLADPTRTATCAVQGVVALAWDPLLGDLCASER